MGLTDIIEDYLLLWILLSVVIGIGSVGFIPAVAALNVLGYGVGFVIGSQAPRSMRISSILSVGMRDFAVAAALVIAAGLPTIASLPAVAFGVVEMAMSAGLVKWFTRRK